MVAIAALEGSCWHNTVCTVSDKHSWLPQLGFGDHACHIVVDLCKLCICFCSCYILHVKDSSLSSIQQTSISGLIRTTQIATLHPAHGYCCSIHFSGELYSWYTARINQSFCLGRFINSSFNYPTSPIQHCAAVSQCNLEHKCDWNLGRRLQESSHIARGSWLEWGNRQVKQLNRIDKKEQLTPAMQFTKSFKLIWIFLASKHNEPARFFLCV